MSGKAQLVDEDSERKVNFELDPNLPNFGVNGVSFKAGWTQLECD